MQLSTDPSDWPTSKAAWLEKVKTDLKGASLEELNWSLSDELTVPPFYHPDDAVEALGPLANGRDDNSWLIGEYIHVERDLKQANQALLEGLASGVQAPLLILERPVTEVDLEQLLDQVQPELINIQFAFNYAEKNPTGFFKDYINWLRGQKVDVSQISGGMDFDPLLDWADQPPMEDMLRLLRLAHSYLPKFHILQVNGRTYHGGPEQTVNELAYTLAKGVAYLNILQDEGYEADAVLPHMILSVSISTSYFVELAKLRALRLLWANVLQVMDLEKSHLPFIEVHLARDSQTKNVNNNYIRAATQAMSAVIGGADTLYIRPANMALQENGTSFTRRIARNVQHLLRMESDMDQVIDPAAGSYYIEALTRQLVERAWHEFLQLEARREFYP